MYTSIITKAEKATLQEDGSLFLDVEFNIMEERAATQDDLTANPDYAAQNINVGDTIKVVVDTKRLSFPIETSSTDVLAEVQRYTANYAKEKEVAAANALVNEELAVADATIAEIIGQEVAAN